MRKTIMILAGSLGLWFASGLVLAETALVEGEVKKVDASAGKLDHQARCHQEQ
jgi:hypothetical protein